jgi:hypothetical protein
MPVHPDVDGLMNHLRINLNSAETIAKGLSKHQFNWTSEPGRWSIGQCLQHLNLIDGEDLGRIRAAVEQGHARGIKAPSPFRYGWLGVKFVNMMEPPITRKFNAPKNYQPSPDVDPEATLNEYRRLVGEYLALAEKARGLDLRRIKTGLSGVPLIRMSLGARLSLIATHDTRHLWQADQVMKHSNFPK